MHLRDSEEKKWTREDKENVIQSYAKNVLHKVGIGEE